MYLENISLVVNSDYWKGKESSSEKQNCQECRGSLAESPASGL